MAYSWTETIEEGADIEVVDIDEIRTVTDLVEDTCLANYTGDNTNHDSDHDASHYSVDDAAAESTHYTSHDSGHNATHDSNHDSGDDGTHYSNHDVTYKGTNYVTHYGSRYTTYNNGRRSPYYLSHQGANTGGEA